MISYSFALEVTWDLSALVSDIVEWLNDATTSKTSKVGTLSSPQFLDLVKTINKNMMTNFHRMIYAESLAYMQADIQDKYLLSAFELHQIGAIAGHKFLNFLGERLEPQALESCSHKDLQVLFLLTVGIILAVGYTRPISSHLTVLSAVSCIKFD
jgi:hypothetical protein